LHGSLRKYRELIPTLFYLFCEIDTSQATIEDFNIVRFLPPSPLPSLEAHVVVPSPFIHLLVVSTFLCLLDPLSSSLYTNFSSSPLSLPSPRKSCLPSHSCLGSFLSFAVSSSSFCFLADLTLPTPPVPPQKKNRQQNT